MALKHNLVAAFLGIFLVSQVVAAEPPTDAQPAASQEAFAQKMRSAYRAMIPSAGAPDPVAEVRSFTIAAKNPNRLIPARLYVPETAAARTGLPVIIYIHGGGFVSGDLDTHDVLTRALANGVQALVIAPDYRLAPEHPFPAGVEDNYAVLQWASAHAAGIGGDPRRIAIAGDSAGANIATVVSMLARDRHGPAVAAQLLIYPNISSRMDTLSWKKYGETNFPTRNVMSQMLAMYAPKGVDPANPLISPLNGNLGQLPPALVQVGGLDPLRDEGRAYAEKLSASGVEASAITYPDAKHGFIQFFKNRAENPLGERGLNDGIDFLRRKLAVK